MEPIEYQLTEEDLVRCHTFHIEWSGDLRKASRKLRYLSILGFILLALLFGLKGETTGPLIFLAAGFAMYFLSPWLLKRSLRKDYHRQARETHGYLLDGPLTAKAGDECPLVSSLKDSKR